RQRAHGPVPPAGDAPRRRTAPSGDHRHPGRLHRRGGVQAGAHRSRVGFGHRGPVPCCDRSAWRLGDGRLRPQRPGTGARVSGRLFGVGVGPGDPELITLKAARLIRNADVVAYHQGVGKQSNARRTAADLVRPGVTEEALVYPVTTQTTDHPGGYAGAMADFYDDCERRVREHLSAGHDVVVLAEGDPMLYGSFMYLHDRLSGEFETHVVPGVPAFAAATATTALPLVRQT